MKFLVVLVLVAAGTPMCFGQEPPPAAPPATEKEPPAPFADGPPELPANTATGMLRVTFDPEMSDLNSTVLYGVLQGAQNAAVQKVAGEGVSKLPRVGFTYNVAAYAPSGGLYVRRIQVSSYDEKISAKDVLRELAQIFQRELQAIVTTKQNLELQVVMQHRHVKELQEQLARARAEEVQLAASLKVDFDPAVAAQKRLLLETELQSLGVESRGLQARKQIIALQIAELGKQVEAGLGPDQDVLKELTNSVEARRRILAYQQERAVARAGGSLPDDIEKAKDQLALAEAELARYRRASADAAGGQRIAELRRRLEDTAIDLAEIDAKRAALQELAVPARKHSLELQSMRGEIELLESEYRRAREELDKLKLEMQRYIPPSVTLIPLP